MSAGGYNARKTSVGRKLEAMKPKKRSSGTKRKRALQRARFAHEYLKDYNGKQAAIRAGYSARSAESQASVLLSEPKVAQLVADGQRKALQSADLSAARVLEEIRRVSFANMKDFWTGTGKNRRLKPIEELTEEQSACLASLEVIIKNAEAGDGKTDKVHKLKLWDKVRALEMLAKHFKLLTEMVQVEDLDARFARLDAGRKRNAERREK